MSTVVIPADFSLPIGIAAFGLAITGLGNVGVGFPISFVGLLLAFQATRVTFEFDDVVGNAGKRSYAAVVITPKANALDRTYIGRDALFHDITHIPFCGSCLITA